MRVAGRAQAHGPEPHMYARTIIAPAVGVRHYAGEARPGASLGQRRRVRVRVTELKYAVLEPVYQIIRPLG